MKGKSTIILSLVMLMLISSITGCAVIMPTVRAGYPEETKIADITAAAVVALQKHDFSIATVNDNIGVVTTNWKDVKSAGMKFLDAMAGKGQSWRMMISVTVDKQTRQINLKPIKQISSAYGGWNNAKLSKGEKEMLNEILKDILIAINAPPTTGIIWEPPGQEPKPSEAEPVETFPEDEF